MNDGPSREPIERLALSRMEERISFLYVERAVVNRDGNALTISDHRGIAHLPATDIAAILLGPGTKVTYAAMALLGDSGCSAVWTGEKGVRFYASGRPPAKSSRMAEAHAKIWANQRSRLDCARRMYQMRFPGEDVSTLTMTQLRGREGARMKKVYKNFAEEFNVPWTRRQYDPQDYASGDPINQALTAASAALYGVSYAVITGLGFIPSLGIVHSGTDRSFVYDIADLYKAEISIPAAFHTAAEFPVTAGQEVRRNVRDRIFQERLMQRMVRDLQLLMEVPEQSQANEAELLLWTELDLIPAGKNWAD